MRSLPILLLLLVVPLQDAQKSDTEADRAKRAAIVDRIMGERPRPQLQLQPMQLVPAPMPAPVVRRIVQFPAGRRITLEAKAVEEAEVADKDDNQDANIVRMAPINISDFALASDNFDRWVFDDELTEGERKKRLNSLLVNKIEAARKAEEFVAGQFRKLELAGAGDIKRFLDRVDTARTDFEAIRQDFNVGRAALGNYDSLTAEYQAGPFGPGSLFEKALHKIKTDKDPATQAGK
jgi:hypothetical protein